MRRVAAVVLVLACGCPAEADELALPALREEIDDYFDARFAGRDDTDQLVRRLGEAGLDFRAVEDLIQRGPTTVDPTPARGWRKSIPLRCDHVDYETVYHLYVPRSYRPDRPAPLVVVGHGGSAVMTSERASRLAFAAAQPHWAREAEAQGFIVAAPVTTRGWGSIGNSVILSMLSRITRAYRIEPNLIYVTGSFMGGHLSWRCGMHMADRFAAVGPMSGGYDFVAKGTVVNLFNVPGYATYGTEDPYGIDSFNERMGAYFFEHRFPWVVARQTGRGRCDEGAVRDTARFFLERRRDLFRPEVYVRRSGRLRWDSIRQYPGWGQTHTWTPGRAISGTSVHWLRLAPREAREILQTVHAVNRGLNRFEIVSSGARRLRLYLHPRMVDFSRPVTVTVNGDVRLQRLVRPDLRTMLELAREYDDRGRTFHAEVEIEVHTDREVPEPMVAASGTGQ